MYNLGNKSNTALFKKSIVFHLFPNQANTAYVIGKKFPLRHIKCSVSSHVKSTNVNEKEGKYEGVNVKLSEVQHFTFTWTYFQLQFYLPAYARVNHGTVLHKRFRRCPRAPGAPGSAEWERENTKITPGGNRPRQLLRAFSFRLPHYLEPGVVSLPAREIYDVVVPRPRSYAPRSPRSPALRFSKRKRKPRRSTGYEYYTKKNRFRARIKHYFTENVEFIEWLST